MAWAMTVAGTHRRNRGQQLLTVFDPIGWVGYRLAIGAGITFFDQRLDSTA